MITVSFEATQKLKEARRKSFYNAKATS